MLWWAVTLAVLVVLDDLTFGPLFWAISRLLGPLAAVTAVYASYVPIQIYLVRRGTSATPGRLADYVLRRLDLERRSERISRNEQALRSKVLGGGSAILLSLVIGGVLPPLLLWRQGMATGAVRRLSIVTAIVYATEFALLHGLIPSLL